VVVSLIVLGAGLAALFDGIVFHQVLQWHHMVSAWHPPDTIDNLKLNTRADGWFHVAAYATLVAGAAMLSSAIARLGTRPPSRVMVAGLLVGFGGFNVLEGVVDHLILGVHHVREGSSAHAYDVGFLVISIIVLAGGIYEYRRANW
jgi:uncharacterized membrane protein